MNMERGPVKTIPIHDHLRSKLCDLYENDCIFDKFETTVSGDGKYFLTGSYHNHFFVIDAAEPANSVSIEASKFSKSKQRVALMGPSAAAAVQPPPPAAASPAAAQGRRATSIRAFSMNPDAIDFSKKILHVAYHPREHTVAIAASNNLFIYHAS
jgi:serine/threonine-protein phosphatase 2A regulatory subunit B